MALAATLCVRECALPKISRISPQEPPHDPREGHGDEANSDDLRRRPGEDKDDYWDRIAHTQGFPIKFYGRVVDQDGKPLKDVEVRPEAQRVLGLALRLAGTPEFQKLDPLYTDSNGLFTISGGKGISVFFCLTKDGYRSYGGGVSCQPGFPQPGFPNGHNPDPREPVELMMLRADMPPNKCVLNRKFQIPWNRGPITLDLGKSVGTLLVDPSRLRPSSDTMNGFDWAVKIQTEGIVITPLESSQPLPRMAPTEGYTNVFSIGATAADSPWLSGMNKTFAIRTDGNRFGTMSVFMNSYGNDDGTGLRITVYLSQPGMRNIDRGGP